MSIRIISFLVSFSLLFLISILILFFFSNTSIKYYIDSKKSELKSYGQLIKNVLENTDLFTLQNKDNTFNIFPQIPEYAYFIIFDKDYNVVFYFPYYFEVDKEFLKRYSQDKDEVVEDKKNYLITYFTPIIIKNELYMLAIEMDLSLIKEFQKSLLKTIVYLLPINVLLSFIFSLLFSNIVIKRLGLIRDFAVKVALGNIYYNAEYNYKDELEDVFRSIKIMKNNLIKLIKDVESSQKTLKNILTSLPFTIFLIDKNTKNFNVLNNYYNLNVDVFFNRIEKEDLIEENDKKFKVMKIDIKEGLLVIIIDFTEIYEIEKIKLKFLSEISHDLRTPIATTKAIISNIKDERVDKALEYLDKMAEMINKYLYYSKIKLRKIEINLEKVSLIDLVEIISDTSSFFSLDFSNPQNIPDRNVKIDISLFQQMLFNILDNARKKSKKVNIKINFTENAVDIFVENEAKYEDYENVTNIFKGLKESKGIGLNIIKEISMINNFSIDILYENGYIIFKISISYASDFI